ANIIGETIRAMHTLSIQHGSLKTYLNKELDSFTAKKEFLEYLKRVFPEKDDVHYEHGVLDPILEMDRAGSLPQCVHVSALSFLPACSLKPPPGCDVTDQLVGEIFQDGFVTASDPLLVTQPAELASLSEDDDARGFYLGYAKGQARAVAILSILLYFMKNEYDLKVVHLKLYESILAIYVHSMKVNSKEEEALLNMKLSCRGSIRRANNIVEVVFMLQNLSNRYGMSDSAGFVRRWNNMSSKQFQITGKRAVALKQLLEVAPKKALDSILAHVGNLGWQQCAWSEEVLSNKKIYPKFNFPCKSKKWIPRVRTTDESLCLMIERVQNLHEAQNQMLRMKMTPHVAEMMAESAAAVLAIAQEISLTAPIDDAKLQSSWVRAWAEGSDHVHTEIQMGLMEKSDSFDPAVHLSTMKRLLDEHIFQAPLAPAEEVKRSLDVDEFNLDMKKLEYDTTVFENWEKKCDNVVAARYHAEQEHKMKIKGQCRKAAEKFLSSCVKISVLTGKVEECIADIIAFKRDTIQKKTGISMDGLPTLVMLNWTTPCSSHNEDFDKQAKVLNWILHENIKNVACVLLPVYSYNRGKLYMEEVKAVKAIGDAGHNPDSSFSLLFKDQVDPRDRRPMSYPGRLVFPAGCSELKDHPFFTCQLRVIGRTKEANQIPGKKMKIIEELWKRKGKCLLESLTTGANLGSHKACFILDLNIKCGEFLESFISQRNVLSTSFFYMGIAETMLEYTWVIHSMQELAEEKIKDGSLEVPGLKMDSKLNDDLLEPYPALPKMNMLVVSGPDKNKLFIPVEVVKKWQNHPQFGGQFSEWLDKFTKKHGVIEDTTKAPGAGAGGAGVPNPLKRAADGNDGIPSPAKKQKVADVCVVDASSIPHALLWEVKVNTSVQVQLQIRANHNIYLINKESKDIIIAIHTMLAQFGKGSFKILTQEELDKKKHHQWEIKDEKELVVMNNVVQTVGAAMQAVANGVPKLAYHKITINDADPKCFTAELTHKIAFVAAETSSEQAAVTPANIASKELPSVWMNEGTIVMWMVRWNSTKGLMPIKPAVYLKGNVTLGAGKACHCSAVATAA
ncbi:unnamed protein product, partial [Prorocentrum cordatum]